MDTIPSSSSESSIIMYTIYTNLSPKQTHSFNTITRFVNRVPIPSMNNNGIASSSKNNSNTSQMRERAATMVAPASTVNFVAPIRSSSMISEQNIGNNIPKERNIEYFK